MMLLKFNSQADTVDALFLKPLHADFPPRGIFRRAIGEVETTGRGSGVGRGVSGAPSRAALWAFRANQPTNLSLVWGECTAGGDKAFRSQRFIAES